MNLLARCSSASTRRHWNDIKDIFYELKGTSYMSLFYPYASQNSLNLHVPRNDAYLIGYADTGYMFDLRHVPKLVISLQYDDILKVYETDLVDTSSNHAELTVFHEVTCECVWLIAVIECIQSTSELSSINDALIIIHRDNAACIDQLKKRYIKRDNTKHIVPKFFF